jgi:hypothetical protein
MLQFRGLFEHLNPNSSHHHRTSDSSSTSTTTTKKKKKKQIPLECLAALRKKEDIIKSGSYERDTFVPPKGKGRSPAPRPLPSRYSDNPKYLLKRIGLKP